MIKYGLIGRSLKHSFSKSFFTDYFSEQLIDACYDNLELDDVEQIQQLLARGDYNGLNITIPYKELILPLLDEITAEALEIGAVNVVQFKDGKTIGHNTDAFGFHQTIKPFLTNKHERALIFGTGGASKAVAHVLKSIGLDVIYISRNPVGDYQFAYEEVNQNMLNACKLLVNTTPVGTFPEVDECLNLPYEFISEDHLVVDLIYNPAKTKFLEMAEAQGATILNGSTMLKQQALKSWKIWTS